MPIKWIAVTLSGMLLLFVIELVRRERLTFKYALGWIAASLTAVFIHFGVYYGRLTSYMENGTRNPGIASALAIIGSLVVGTTLYFLLKKKEWD